MRVKGSALKARARWAHEQGDAVWQALLEGLSPEARETTEEGFLASAWYEYELFVEICEELDRQHGQGDQQFCYQLGRWACDANLPTLYRLFFKLGNPHFIIKRAASAWRVNYDEGEVLILREQEKSVTFEIRGVPRPTRAHCLSVLGWTVRASELSGAVVDEASIKTTCQADGDEVCSFAFSWK